MENKKYRLCVAIEYTIKFTDKEVVMEIPKLKKRMRQAKRLTEHLERLKKSGWEIKDIDISDWEEQK